MGTFDFGVLKIYKLFIHVSENIQMSRK